MAFASIRESETDLNGVFKTTNCIESVTQNIVKESTSWFKMADAIVFTFELIIIGLFSANLINKSEINKHALMMQVVD